MSDLKADGTPLEVKGEHPAEQTKTQQTDQPEKPTLRAPGQGIELTPTYIRGGNELVVIAKMLESLNRNVAFLAQTIHLHLNPEVKDGRPKAER